MRARLRKVSIMTRSLTTLGNLEGNSYLYMYPISYVCNCVIIFTKSYVALTLWQLCQRYQIWINLLLWIVSAYTGVAVVVFSFSGYAPNYRCRIPYCEEQTSTNNYSYENGTFPVYVTKGTNSQCDNIRKLSTNNAEHSTIEI